MKAYFQKLFEYNNWANQAILDALFQLKTGDLYNIKLLSHIINAQYIWLGRLVNLDYGYAVWEIHRLEDMQNLLKENHRIWLAYLDKAEPEEFLRIASYTNSKGEPFQTLVQDCLAQTINHSTYHRAQIAKALRNLDMTPPNTDYITFCRLTGDMIYSPITIV